MARRRSVGALHLARHGQRGRDLQPPRRTEPGVESVRQLPVEHRAAVPADDGTPVDEASLARDRGEVSRPVGPRELGGAGYNLIIPRPFGRGTLAVRAGVAESKVRGVWTPRLQRAAVSSVVLEEARRSSSAELCARRPGPLSIADLRATCSRAARCGSCGRRRSTGRGARGRGRPGGTPRAFWGPGCRTR